MTVSVTPVGCDENYRSVLTTGAVQFVAKLSQKFRLEVHAVSCLRDRLGQRNSIKYPVKNKERRRYNVISTSKDVNKAFLPEGKRDTQVFHFSAKSG